MEYSVFRLVCLLTVIAILAQDFRSTCMGSPITSLKDEVSEGNEKKNKAPKENSEEGILNPFYLLQLKPQPV